MFGVPLQWAAADPNTESWLSAAIERRAASYGEALDPDCYYRPRREGRCKKPDDAAAARRIAAAAEAARAETGGVFEVRTKKGRDFGGIAQGFFLDELARAAPGPFFADFAGDMYLSPGMKAPKPLAITDPHFAELPYARVEMRAGWLIASGGRKFGTEVRRAGERETIPLIFLFAEPGFDGARLDGWATAAVAGGPETLKRLWGLKSFHGRWAYLYYDEGAASHCSENLECRLDGPGRLVKVPW